MSAVLILCALSVGYVCRGLTDKWLMWRQYRKGEWLG